MEVLAEDIVKRTIDDFVVEEELMELHNTGRHVPVRMATIVLDSGLEISFPWSSYVRIGIPCAKQPV